MAHIAVKTKAKAKARRRGKPESATPIGNRSSKRQPSEEENATKEPPDIDVLRTAVKQLAANVEVASAEATRLRARADSLIADAKTAYRIALVPYRNACRRTGARCDFDRTRTSNVSERVTFLVEKAAGGIKVTVKGRPETAELIPSAKLCVSINKSAYQYVEKHLGSRKSVGNKGGNGASCRYVGSLLFSRRKSAGTLIDIVGVDREW